VTDVQTTATPSAAVPARDLGRRPFARHFGEMVLAMVLGMIVLGGAFEGAFALGGSSLGEQPAAVAAVAMAFSMTVPMVAWMHRRGHAPARLAEMAGAMAVTTLAAIALDVAGAIPPAVVLAVQHVAMIPAMLGVMLWRREEYSHRLRHHGAG
jgi:hypothetical protein